MVDSFNQSLDRLKESFLWAAAQGGNTEDCESLLEIGADVNWKHTDGDTPLLAACRRGHTETIETLIVHGADVDACGGDKLTPLHICCLRGDYPSLNVILTASPSLSARTKDGKTALQLAEAKGYEDVCSRMKQYIANSSSGISSKLQSRPMEFATSNHTGNRQSSLLLDRSESREKPHAAALRQSRGIASAVEEETGSSSSVINAAIAGPNSTTPGTNTSGRSTRPLPSIPFTGISDDAKSLSPRLSSRASAQTQQSSSMIAGGSGDTNAPASKLATLPSTAPNIPSRPIIPSTASYTLMGQHISPGHDEASIALRKQLDFEQKERKLLEARVHLLEEEVCDLGSLNATLTDQLEDMHSENSDISAQLALLSGATIEKFVSLNECEALEKKLKDILKHVEEKKAKLIAKELDSQKEQRLCVICQEGEKSVVLLPCRHMCLCQECSSRDDVEHCPLCRRPIIQRISVFS